MRLNVNEDEENHAHGRGGGTVTARIAFAGRPEPGPAGAGAPRPVLAVDDLVVEYRLGHGRTLRAVDRSPAMRVAITHVAAPDLAKTILSDLTAKLG